MPSLHELQAGFLADIDRETLHDLNDVINDGRFPANSLMQVYRNNYFISLTDALRSIFVSTEKLVGEGFFAFIADGYIRKYPSTSGNLHDFGHRFSDYISDVEQASSLPYLPDVARLDWKWHRAYHAADAAPVSADKLAAFEPENYGLLTFELLPSLSFTQSNYSISDIWHFCRDDSELSEGRSLDFDKGAEYIMTYRAGLEIRVEVLAADEFLFLRSLGERETLAATAEIVISKNEQFDLLSCLQKFLGLQLFTDVSLSSN